MKTPTIVSIFVGVAAVIVVLIGIGSDQLVQQQIPLEQELEEKLSEFENELDSQTIA